MEAKQQCFFRKLKSEMHSSLIPQNGERRRRRRRRRRRPRQCRCQNGTDLNEP